ncbi:MAG TPA: SDR family NAD(P)-dependent oxidoreductase [Chloroflexota bacterium]|nr:SDR family NAD(P)-dependent oxidoreductase [Chloroflexota bacterium]
MPTEQRVALVTGAARGIGAAIAERLARDGACVAVADLDEAAAEEQAERIRTQRNSAFAVRLDVADPASPPEAIARVLEREGRLDILVNNAGIAGLAAPVVDYPENEWRRILAIDVDGVFYCCKAVLPHMLERGSGRIVNIASISGKEGNPTMAAYSTAKAGVIGFTKALAKEVATRGIYVNCVTPAVIATEILTQLSDEAVGYMTAKIPMGRTGQPEEVAALVAWLASDECSFSTGAVFDISGGRATY